NLLRELWQFLRAEHDQAQREDDYQLAETEIEHERALARKYLRLALGLIAGRRRSEVGVFLARILLLKLLGLFVVTVFHRLLEPFDGGADIGADVAQFAGAEHSEHNNQNDDPMPDTHVILRENPQ